MNERDIFLAAIEIADLEERAAYVERACGTDAAMRAQVEELLRSHEETSQFLETPAGEIGTADTETILLDSSSKSDPQGSRNSAAEEEFRRYLEPSTREGWLGRLAHYEIEEILGRGAFGIVAKAFDEKLHRVVAIKMLSPELATTSPPRKRFLREARTTAAVPHENLVGIFAVEDEPIPYLVMEYIAGETLEERLKNNGPLDVSEVLRIGRQIAAGMAAAHSANLIHRDIKPSNILISDGPNERTKISDFGMARAVDDASMTTSGMIAGTPMYMAPEQARGETLDHRADLFSLGSVLYQMTCGRPPFRASNTMAVLKRVCEDRPRPLYDVLPGTPPWLSAIIDRLLEKDPDDRFQTAQEVADLLARCESELKTQGKVTCVDALLPQADEHPTPEPASQSGGSGRRVGLFVTGIVAVAAVIGLLVINGNRDPGRGDFPDGTGAKTASVDSDKSETPPGIAQGHDYALSFDGKDDYVEIPTLTFDSNHPVTLETWVAARRIDRHEILVRFAGKDGKSIALTNLSTGDRWNAGYRVALRSDIHRSTSSPKVSPGVWTHLAVVWDGESLHFFVDGVAQRTTLDRGDPDDGNRNQLQWHGISMGRGLSETGVPLSPPGFSGELNEVRISKVARYTDDFTPAKRFEADEQTLALYHFDQGSGDKLVDSSGNDHHGTIHGATWVRVNDSNSTPGNHALLFDGKDDYVDIPTLKYDGSHPFTVEVWCRTPEHRHQVLAAGWGDHRVSISNVTLGHDPNSYWTFGREFGDGKWRYHAGVSKVLDNSITHLATVWDGKSQRLFINGKQLDGGIANRSNTGETTKRKSSDSFTLGAHLAVDWAFFGAGAATYHGIIDEVRISKTARYTEDFTPETRLENDEHTLALYHFDTGSGDVLKDSSGNGHDGTIVGANWVRVDDQLQVIEPALAANHALMFDGKDDYVDIPTLTYDGSHPITLEAWVVVDGPQPAMSGQQFGTGYILSNKLPWSGVTLTVQGLRPYFSVSAVSDTVDTNFRHAPSAETLQPRTAAHVAGVFDGKTARIYVNGILRRENTDERPHQPSTGSFSLGLNPVPTADFFNGIIDEVRISKTARYTHDFTPEKRFEADDDTLALYHFDTGTGDVLKDSSGNGHDGRIVGAAWVKVDDALNVQAYVWPEDQPDPAIAPFTADEATRHQEEWAEHLGVPVEMENSIGMKFRVIPPGEFLMGSSEEEIEKLLATEENELIRVEVLDESPSHRAIITNPFAAGIHEVTRGQFRRFVEATGYRTVAEVQSTGQGMKSGQQLRSADFDWKSNPGFDTAQSDDHPVINVTWTDAVAFCKWLSDSESVVYRLPTETEWEAICRAGSTTRYHFDSTDDLPEYAWCQDSAAQATQPVGLKRPNPYGVFDLYGNVTELCLDGRDTYLDAVSIDPRGRSNGNRYAVRGGAFRATRLNARSARRLFVSSSANYFDVGFRIVRTFEKYEAPKTPEPVETTYTWPEDQPGTAIAPFTADEAKQHQEQWAEHLGVDAERQVAVGAGADGNAASLQMVLVPPGEYLMGMDEADSERFVKLANATGDQRTVAAILSESPQHKVRLTRPFWIGKHEVTWKQFRQFIEAENYQLEAFKTDEVAKQTAEQFLAANDTAQSVPIINVTWNDATAFANWLSAQHEGLTFRLPTEAEWEYACRAGTTTAWHTGDYDTSLHGYGLHKDSSDKPDLPYPVGKYKPNPFGLHDMHLGVREWCADWYAHDYYANSPVNNPAGPPQGTSRSYRGGAWNIGPFGSRSAVRNQTTPDRYGISIGFRLVADIEVANATTVTSDDTTTDPYARDRAAAEWILSKGGGVDIMVDGQVEPVSRVEDLPMSAYRIHGIGLRDTAGSTAEDFERLANLIGVRHVRGVPSDTGLRWLKNAPRLTLLTLGDRDLNAEDLISLRHLTGLSTIELPGTVAEGRWDALSQLPHLERIWIHGPGISPEMVKGIGQLPSLRHVAFSAAEIDPRVADLIHQENPRLRVTTAKLQIVGDDPMATAARSLIADRVVLGGANPDGIWNSSDTFDDSRPFDIRRVELPAETALTPERLRQIEDVSTVLEVLSIKNVSNADAWIEALSHSIFFPKLEAANSKLTDAGLTHLRRLKHLGSLDVRGTQVTEAAIRNFKRHVPGCEVISDYGTFPYEHKLPEGWQALVDPYARDRAAAEWVIENGGRVLLETDVWVNDDAEIPAQDYRVVSIDMRGSRDAEAIDPSRVSGLIGLESVNPHGCVNFDASLIYALRDSPRLARLAISGTSIQSSQITGLNHHSGLRTLTLDGGQIDDWRFLDQIPSLQVLDILNSPKTWDFDALRRHSLMRALYLRGDTPQEEVIERIQQDNPNLRILLADRNKWRVAGDDPLSQVISKLAARGLVMRGSVNGKAWSSEERATVEGPEVFVDYVVIPPAAKLLTAEECMLLSHLRLSADVMTTFGITASGVAQADQLAQRLAASCRFESLDLSKSDLTDAGLSSLATLVHLDSINVTGTQVTEAAIREFKRHVPGCEVVSDFGTFPYEHKLPEGWNEQAVAAPQP